MRIAPLTEAQYCQLQADKILDQQQLVDWDGGYLVGKPLGNGYAWPGPEIPADAPRLQSGSPIWPISIDEYERMIKFGVLIEGSPSELLEGYLIAKDRGNGAGMSHGPNHAVGVQQVGDTLRDALGKPWVARIQLPISLGSKRVPTAGSEPEPDITVAEGPNRRYLKQHPRVQDIRLLVEVADSSLRADRLVKAGTFAKAGVSLYWVVNLIKRQLEVFSDPDRVKKVYRSKQIFGEDEIVTLNWDGLAPVTIKVSDLLP